MRCISTPGNNSTPHRDPRDPPRRRAHQRQGHGTSANDRPPIIGLSSRETGEQRWWVGDHANTRTCAALLAENMPLGRTRLSPDEWQSYRGSHPCHATVRHGGHAWAREDDGDGRRAVHCPTCEGAGATLRTYPRAFRGVHQRYLHLYVATYAAMVKTTRVTPQLIRRRCVHNLSAHTGAPCVSEFINPERSPRVTANGHHGWAPHRRPPPGDHGHTFGGPQATEDQTVRRPAMATSMHMPVLIVGGGPVGLTAALLLSRSGVKS
jgi:transposase